MGGSGFLLSLFRSGLGLGAEDRSVRGPVVGRSWL
jgi:hypothetical protein